MLKAVHISKKYRKKDKDALHDFSYEFKDKGLYLLTGVSGSGKSTLLNILSATDLDDKGKLYFDDVVVGKRNAFSYRNHISSICFQELNLIPALSVEENLKISFELAGKEYSMKRAGEILRKVNLPDKKEELSKFLLRNVNELSGRQRQRVAVARCFVKDTKALFCDEPTASLDEKNAISLVNILTELSKEILVIVATHSPSIFQIGNPTMLSIEDGIVIGCPLLTDSNEASETSFGKPRVLKLGSMLAITRSFFRKSKTRLILNLLFSAICFATFSAMNSAMRMEENTVLLKRQLHDGNNLVLVRELSERKDESEAENHASLQEHQQILKDLEAHPLFSLSNVMHSSQSFLDGINGPITHAFSYIYDDCALELWEGENAFVSRDPRLEGNSSCHRPETEKEVALSSFYADCLL